MDATEIDVLSAGNPSRAVFPRVVNLTLRRRHLARLALPTAGRGATTTAAVFPTSLRLPAPRHLSARVTASGNSSNTTASPAPLRHQQRPLSRPLRPCPRSRVSQLHHRSPQLLRSPLLRPRRRRAATVVTATSCKYHLHTRWTQLRLMYFQLGTQVVLSSPGWST